MNGIGNRMSGEIEIQERKVIIKEWLDRALRHVPGTHTLGKEFQTVEPEKKR